MSFPKSKSVGTGVENSSKIEYKLRSKCKKPVETTQILLTVVGCLRVPGMLVAIQLIFQVQKQKEAGFSVVFNSRPWGEGISSSLEQISGN